MAKPEKQKPEMRAGAEMAQIRNSFFDSQFERRLEALSEIGTG